MRAQVSTSRRKAPGCVGPVIVSGMACFRIGEQGSFARSKLPVLGFTLIERFSSEFCHTIKGDTDFSHFGTSPRVCPIFGFQL